MAKSNRDRMSEGLELLLQGLIPFVERELIDAYGNDWLNKINAGLKQPLKKAGDLGAKWDNYALLQTMKFNWSVFAKTLDNGHRSMVHTVLDARNKWAHDEAFSYDDAHYALVTMRMLLEACSAGEASAAVGRLAEETMRVRMNEQRRVVTRKIRNLEVNTKAGLRPWREIVTPHPDVAEGRYQQAEFAADLAQVHRGDAAPEYGDPKEFFRRTYLTDGLRSLLVNGLRRLSGKGGDPVVQLQTNFGGGKTHSMLALYHLFGGAKSNELVGLDNLLTEEGIKEVPHAARAVFVGTAFGPGAAHKKPDGTTVHTIWGEMGWQLGNSRGKGKQGYKLVQSYDRDGVNPGSDALTELFDKFGPCLILIDEWVAFLRQLHGDKHLACGTLETNFTFVQSLSEAAKRAKNTLLIASLPQSNLETGGERGVKAHEHISGTLEIGGEVGKKVLKQLEHHIGRLETSWRPATAEEGFEIVRRRLFLDIPPENAPSKEAVVKEFGKQYSDRDSFPTGTDEKAYMRQMEGAYPFHPELFKRFYNEWSTLPRFQRTRGVLRLMAAVIHALWDSGDKELLIMPSSIPLDDPKVRSELQQYLEERWEAVFDTDMDGEDSAARRTDNAVSRLGRYSAARRVARAIFMATAPTHKSQTPGVSMRDIKLACVQPGEVPEVFEDAARRLAGQTARYLYNDGDRYWFSPVPTVAGLADDRAEQQSEEDIVHEVSERVKALSKNYAPFRGVHPCPTDSSVIPDDRVARIVVFGPEFSHDKGTESKALQGVREIMESRGNGVRFNRNMLVFLAPDGKSISGLKDVARTYLAWQSIIKDATMLDLPRSAYEQAKAKCADLERTLDSQIRECWHWALVPIQPDARASDYEIEAQRVKGDQFIGRVAAKLIKTEQLYEVMGAERLTMVLDEHLWRDQPHIGLKHLWEEGLAKYLYLPRMLDETVLIRAVQRALAGGALFSEFLAYAESYDEEAGRYRGLRVKGGEGIELHPEALLVKAEVANAQVKQEHKPPEEQDDTKPDPDGEQGKGSKGEPPEKQLPTLFTAERVLNPDRVIKEVGDIVREVIEHLEGLPKSTVRVTLDIEGSVPDGVPENVQRIVLENAKTLKLDDPRFG
jgi:uncharacterized protein